VRVELAALLFGIQEIRGSNLYSEIRAASWFSSVLLQKFLEIRSQLEIYALLGYYAAEA
jgi:hypothetical protein